MSSILRDTKEFSNLSDDNKSFDTVIIMYINGCLAYLNQMGVGPKIIYQIVNYNEEWSNFSDNMFIQTTARTYITAKTKLQFDPPITVAHLEALKETISESEWRLQSYIIAPPSLDDAVPI